MGRGGTSIWSGASVAVVLGCLSWPVLAADWTMRPVARPDPGVQAGARFRPPPRPVSGVVDGALRRPPPRPERPVTDVIVMSDPHRPKPRPATLRSIAVPRAPEPVDPPPRRKPAPAPVPAPSVGPADVVMVGDSITAGGRWASHFPGVRIVNRGVSGDTALNILGRMEGIYQTRPRKALLMFGINDIYNGVPEDRIVQRYDKIVALLKARKIEVVIQSTLECTGAVCGEKLARVRSLNARLRALAKKRRVRFVDINGLLSDGGGLKTAFSRDGVHMNGDGYARWYTLLKPHVRS